MSPQAALYTCLDCRDDIDKQGPRHTKGWEGARKVMRDRTVYKFKTRDMVAAREILVPTCSYRMGVPSMGYGAAVMGELLKQL